MAVRVTQGDGSASVASELISNNQYQQIKVVDGTASGTTGLKVNADGSINITGSVAAIVTTNPNQSVSGTIGASVIGIVPIQTANTSVISYVQNSVATVIIGGSIAASFTPPANQSVSGTTGASVIGWIPTQPSNTSTIGVIQASVAVAIVSGSIAATFTPPANQSVSGTIGASIIGLPTVQTGNTSVIALIQGSVAVAFAASANQSVSGTVGASVIGWVPTQPSNTSTIGVIQGSIAVAIISGSIAATFTPPANQSVSGAVNVSGSVLLGSSNASVIALLQTSSIIAINAGSVIAIPSGSVITVWKDSSVLSVPVGSVITVLQAASIVGTYAEDAASASGDKGFFVMGARNDTLASVTSADGDYSSHVVGPAGELIAENAPLNKWISGTASMLGGTPVTGSLVPIIAAQGASIFSYITGLQVANASATNVWITLLGGTNSVVGFTVAPANGGSNIYYENGLKTSANAAFSASISAVASVYLSAQGFISKT